ncbi:hypothetical protein BOX15_Mlig017471g1, partial [Macrostomum lignano]
AVLARVANLASQRLQSYSLRCLNFYNLIGMEQPRSITSIRNPPFRLQLVLPAPADAAATASNQHQQHRWIPAPSLASPPPPQQHPRQLYAQLQQLYRRRLRTVETDVNDDDDADGSRPVSSDSGISDCCCINQQQLQRSQQQTPSDTDAAAPACRICLTSLSKVGPSAAANCGHVACLPCLLAWYRTRSVCFCCRTGTTGFTLLYL